MKPFNIEAAKRGEKVVTRDGRPVRILAFDAKNHYPMVGLVEGIGEENAQHFCLNGRYLGVEDSKNDLFMAEGSSLVFNHKLIDTVDKNRLLRLPFDLQAAKAGALMVTRDGRLARLIKSDCKGYLPLVAIVMEDGDELACNYTESGRIYDDETEDRNSNCDLFMVGLTENNY